jgi:hypothetical protein
LVWGFWRGGEGRECFKVFMFGSIFRRGGEGFKIPFRPLFASPQIGGIWRGGEAIYVITVLIILA